MRTVVLLPIGAASLAAGAVAAWCLGFAGSMLERSRSVWESVALYVHAIRGGTVSAHAYEALTLRGVAHAEAVERALAAPSGIVPARPSRPTEARH